MNVRDLLKVQDCLNASFPNDDTLIANFIGGNIVVDNAEISEVDIGEATGYSLAIGVPYAGFHDEPDGVDVVEICASLSFNDVVLALVSHIAESRATKVLNNLADEEWHRQMVEDARQAKEYFANYDNPER